MKIDKIQQNYYAYPQNQQRQYSPSFQSAPLTERITNSLAGKNVLKFMKEKLSWMKGEIGGVGMTALGTGLVAPWPIAFNPFVKAPKDATPEEVQDVKNTKIYTAWRQPISAVLAGIFQILAIQPIDKGLDYIYNTPEFAKHFDIDTNQSLVNNDNFVKRTVQKQMKAEGKTAKSLGKQEFEALLKERVKAYKDKQISDLAEQLKTTHQISVGGELIDNSKVAKIVNEQLDSYIEDATKLKIDKKGLTFYSERAKVLIENEAHIREIFSNLPKEDAALQEHLKCLLTKESNRDVRVLIEEILERSPEIRQNRIDRTLARIGKIKELCGGTYSFDNYMDAMAKRNAELDKVITKLEMSKIKDLRLAEPQVIEKAIKEAIEHCHFEEKNSLLESILHDTQAFNTKKEKLVDKIYKDVAKGYKKFVSNSYKSHNQLWKILIGVCITLPITCNVLNWVYPRFMNLVFPKLAGSKAKQAERQAEREKEVG